MSYVLKVLESEEFEKLPYKHVKEALGCADPKTNTAYVRRVHWGEASKLVNLLTMQHELDELVAKTSPHEEDGIRYKKGGVLKNVVPLILGAIAAPFTGGASLIPMLLGAASSIGMNQYAQSRHPDELGKPGQIGSILMQGITGAAGGYGGGQIANAIGSIGAGTAGGAGSTMLGAAKTGVTGSSIGGTALQQGVTGSASTGIGATGGTLASLGTGAAAAPTFASSLTPTLLSSVASGGASVMSSMANSPALMNNQALTNASTLPPVASTSKNIWTNLTSMNAKSIGSMLDSPVTKLGLGALATSAFVTSPTPPDVGDITSKWLTSDSVTRAGALAKGIAEDTMTNDFTVPKETTALINVMQSDITKAYKQRAKDLDRMGSATNDNWKGSGERLELLRRLGDEENAEKTKVETEMISTAQTQYAQQRYNYVINGMAVDEQTKRDLLYGELSDVMWRYNVQQTDLMNFRQLAADAGIYLLSKGTGVA